MGNQLAIAIQIIRVFTASSRDVRSYASCEIITTLVKNQHKAITMRILEVYCSSDG